MAMMLNIIIANDQPPELDHMASVTVIVPEISANSVFRFVDMSLQATVDDSQYSENVYV